VHGPATHIARGSAEGLEPVGHLSSLPSPTPTSGALSEGPSSSSGAAFRGCAMSTVAGATSPCRPPIHSPAAPAPIKKSGQQRPFGRRCEWGGFWWWWSCRHVALKLASGVVGRWTHWTGREPPGCCRSLPRRRERAGCPDRGTPQTGTVPGAPLATQAPQRGP